MSTDANTPEEGASQSPAFDPDYLAKHGGFKSESSEVEPVYDRGLSQRVTSFILGVIFGVLIPLGLKFFFLDIMEFLSPSQTLPVQGQDPNSYSGMIDLNSSASITDQLMEKLAYYSTAIWVLALVYLMPIVYQLRVAVIFDGFKSFFSLALTLLGPSLVLLILPLWGELAAAS